MCCVGPRIRSWRTNDTIRGDTKLESECNTSKERDSYLFRVKKLDIEMPPDSLETDGVNDSETSVVVTVDESAQGTHRERSSNSNTEFILIICSLKSGTVSWIFVKPAVRVHH